MDRRRNTASSNKEKSKKTAYQIMRRCVPQALCYFLLLNMDKRMFNRGEAIGEEIKNGHKKGANEERSRRVKRKEVSEHKEDEKQQIEDEQMRESEIVERRVGRV